jgi:hypothetical protein
MSRQWHGRIRELTLSAGSVLFRLRALVPLPDAVTHRDTWAPPRGGLERRADAFTADVVQVGVMFMLVFGRRNAETFFATAGIEAAVYRRIIAGRFRRLMPGGDPASEGVPV